MSSKFRVLLWVMIVVFATLFNFYFRPIAGNPKVNEEYRKSPRYINDLYNSDEYFKNKMLNEQGKKLYDSIIKASINGDYHVTLPCEKSTCGGDFNNAYTALYLDHPELLSFFGIKSYMITSDGVTYTNYENVSKFRVYMVTKRMEREMENIRKDVKDMSDSEKIVYVYDYVASHKYDHLLTFTGSNQSAYSFFTKSSSVCAGFAKTSQIIFQNIGIDSYLVLSNTHMWNYVKYDGKYYIFDATVGASLGKDRGSDYYDGLGRTTVDDTPLNIQLYPKIEEKHLKELFGL